MEKKKTLQILFFVLLGIGFVLMMFRLTRSYAYVFLGVIQPIIALYYIYHFKQSESVENIRLKLRIPVLILLQMTFVVLSLNRLTSTMHWPYGGVVSLLAFALTIITMLFGMIYIIVNRKAIQSIFVFELIMFSLPILFFISWRIPTNYSTEQYSDVLNQQYQELNSIEAVLYENEKRDTLIDLSMIDFITEIKSKTIHIYGGYTEDGELVGSLNKVDMTFVEWQFKNKQKETLIQDMLQHPPKTVIEYLNALTKLQIDLLLKDGK